ncbi:hypothetical protein [Paraburkholderia antibiotica]|uniref:Secreted protein n=1 Tax=Paraburkholderia antibiotica TaxID=2728839 RepID=A0A7X9X6Y3_9BURK|nr:hypothetical protein [Paraburkholderia antibiotica]NML32576.1 hypothetical protein [Paraburkholderia antibiotica]
MRQTSRAVSSTLFATLAAVAVTWGSASSPARAASPADPFAWPSSFVVLGDGYPHSGDVCRRLGESAATANYLDHTAMLVGCPGPGNSAAAHQILQRRHARVVGETDGVTLISIATESTPASHQNDRKHHTPTKASPFATTGTLPCERGDGPTRTRTMCKFGIVHHDDRSTTVVVYWPDDETRAIFFSANGRVIGTAATASDRPTSGNTLTQKNAGVNRISVSHERYEIEDKLLTGN